MNKTNLICSHENARRGTTIGVLLALSFLGFTAPRALAQPASSEAYRFIQITEDNIKPGGFDTYESLQQEKARVLKAANWRRISLGLTHRFGPTSKVYHYSFFKTLDEIDADQKALGAENPELRRALKKIADQEAAVLIDRNVGMVIYKPDISYQGDYDWASFRMMSVINIQLKPGMHDVYKTNRLITLQGKKAAKAPQNIAIYANFCGMQSWQYFIIRPVKALKAFDDLESFIHSATYTEKFGDENHKKMIEAFGQSVATEHEYYLAFDPALSYTTAEWAGANADFWKP